MEFSLGEITDRACKALSEFSLSNIRRPVRSLEFHYEGVLPSFSVEERVEDDYIYVSGISTPGLKEEPVVGFFDGFEGIEDWAIAHQKLLTKFFPDHHIFGDAYVVDGGEYAFSREGKSMVAGFKICDTGALCDEEGFKPIGKVGLHGGKYKSGSYFIGMSTQFALPLSHPGTIKYAQTMMPTMSSFMPVYSRIPGREKMYSLAIHKIVNGACVAERDEVMKEMGIKKKLYEFCPA